MWFPPTRNGVLTHCFRENWDTRSSRTRSSGVACSRDRNHDALCSSRRSRSPRTKRRQRYSSLENEFYLFCGSPEKNTSRRVITIISPGGRGDAGPPGENGIPGGFGPPGESWGWAAKFISCGKQLVFLIRCLKKDPTKNFDNRITLISKRNFCVSCFCALHTSLFHFCIQASKGQLA